MLKKTLKSIFGENFVTATRDFLLKKIFLINGKLTVSLQYRYLLQNRFSLDSTTYDSETVLTDKNSLQRNKPYILFVTEKWCDCNPLMGITNSEHNLLGSLKCSDLANHKQFHFDEYYYEHQKSGDIALIELCLKSKPDLIVLTWWPGKIFSSYNPKLETLRIISADFKIPIVAIWFDSVLSKVMAIAEAILPLVRFNVLLDSTVSYLDKTKFPEKYLPLWTPQNPKLFHNPNLTRDIDICFLGSTYGYTDRLLGITALKNSGINVYQAGGQRESRLTPEEYAEILMRSKIVLNFSYARFNNLVQAKGRIFEATLCGAMLLESANSETAKWFEPMYDYVPFEDETDLVKKARYYIANDEERLTIAQRGHHKALTNYTGEIFWRTILDKAIT